MHSINELPKNEFISCYGNVFESSTWIAEQVFKKKPFENFTDLAQKMLEIFENSTIDQQIEILLNHPDLADKAKISKISYDSQIEQKSSKLDECTEKDFEEFHSLNHKYKEKFGFPFIIAVSGINKNEILNRFKNRILSEKKIEFKEAKNQVKKIASIRLNEIKKDLL